MDVLITVDTEFSPRSIGDPSGYARWIARDFDGRTKAGDFGVAYQLARFAESGVRACFMVESLHATTVGFDALDRIVDAVKRGGHDLQLHVHSEWRPAGVDPLPGRDGARLCHFSEDAQLRMIEAARDNLVRAGAPAPVALRAGHYAADSATLRAAARAGLKFDSSYSRALISAGSDFPAEPPIVSPRRMEGVVEVPISCFRHLPGRYRPAQLCACSAAELDGALIGSALRGDPVFTVVSHSFELVARRDGEPEDALPNPLVRRRFESLLATLSSRKDLFRTTGFDRLDADALAATKPVEPLRSPLGRTLARYAQQITGLGS